MFLVLIVLSLLAELGGIIALNILNIKERGSTPNLS